MKKLTATLVSLAAVTLVAYYIMGSVVENTFNKQLNAIPKNPVFGMKLDEYKRGLFSATANLVVDVHTPEKIVDATVVAKAEDIQFTLPLEISHGPFIVTDYGVRFGMGEVSTSPQSHFSALVSYFNHTIWGYNFPGFSMTSNDVKFQWKGFSTRASISSNVDDIDSKFTFFGIEGSSDRSLVKIDKIDWHLNLNQTKDGLWLEQFHLTLPAVVIQEQDKKSIELEALDFKVGSDEANGGLNIDWNLSLNKVLAEGKTYGPIAIHLSLKNLDAVTMAKTHKLEWEMLQNNQPPELQIATLAFQLPQLLSRGAELELSTFNVTLPEGNVTGNFKLSLPKNESGDINQLLKKAKGEGQFKASIDAVKALIISLNKQESSTQTQVVDSTTSPETNTPSQASAFLQNLVDKGVLKVEGTDYVVDFKLEDQHVTVNGKDFNPDMLK